MTEMELLECLHGGIRKTNSLHMRWTGGWWVTAYGVEHFLVGNVARFIMKHRKAPTYATLETLFSEIFSGGGKLPKGPRTQSNKGNNRLDLALYDANNLIHALEFKRFWDPKCLHDIQRLHDLLKILGKSNGGTVKTGTFTLLVTCKARSQKDITSQLDSAFERYEDKCSEYIENCCLNRGTTSYYFSRATEFFKPQVTKEGHALSSLCLVMK